MHHQIEYAEESDAPGLARINTLSFDSPVLPNMFPGSGQATLQAYKAKYAMKHLASPTTHVLKMDDPASGEIVGYGRWHIPEALAGTSVPELSESALVAARDPLQFAPQTMNQSLFTAFRGMLEESRKRHTTEQDMILDLLATLPGYQGQGIGTAMLRWGMAKADAWQRRIYLEATPAGYPVYIKHGWRVVEEISLDFSQHGGVGSEPFLLMMRDPLVNRDVM